MNTNELFLAALVEARTLMSVEGEELRKQALAYLLAADLQHRTNVQAWLMMLVNPTEDDELPLQERYDAALQMALAQRDQGQLAQLIAHIAEMDWDVGIESDLLEATFEVVEGEYRDMLNAIDRQPATDWSVIEKLNRLVEE